MASKLSDSEDSFNAITVDSFRVWWLMTSRGHAGDAKWANYISQTISPHLETAVGVVEKKIYICIYET